MDLLQSKNHFHLLSQIFASLVWFCFFLLGPKNEHLSFWKVPISFYMSDTNFICPGQSLISTPEWTLPYTYCSEEEEEKLDYRLTTIDVTSHTDAENVGPDVIVNLTFDDYGKLIGKYFLKKKNRRYVQKNAHLSCYLNFETLPIWSVAEPLWIHFENCLSLIRDENLQIIIWFQIGPRTILEISVNLQKKKKFRGGGVKGDWGLCSMHCVWKKLKRCEKFYNFSGPPT